MRPVPFQPSRDPVLCGVPVGVTVTIGPGAERRLARALRAAGVGQAASLNAVLTTTGFLESARSGPLGPSLANRRRLPPVPGDQTTKQNDEGRRFDRCDHPGRSFQPEGSWITVDSVSKIFGVTSHWS
jgi:hypothetical protein